MANSLMRFDPFRELARFDPFRDFDDLLRDVVEENDQAYLIKADMPGVNKEEIEDVQRERPAQQPGPIQSRSPLLLCFRLRCFLRRGARLLRLRLYPRLGEQKWPEFRARSEDAVESREVCSRWRNQGRYTP
jgi:hypothetical protein